MPLSTLHIPHSEAARIIKRLTNHWKHKMDIIQQDNISIIPFADDVQCRLIAEPTQIIAELTTNSHEQLDTFEDVVLRHLNRMAHEEFAVAWQRH
ncbi:MAG: DUF2218 domain-containing protein [Acinetobacter sp.]|nr:DUF2218 domain-containing protein [Acinetobacter sp.]